MARSSQAAHPDQDRAARARANGAPRAEQPDDNSTQRRGKIRRAVAATAPQLAHALGGPLAGAAVSAIAKAVFGEAAASETEIEARLERLSPDDISALQAADRAFALAVRDSQTLEARIHADDRHSARARHMAMADVAPAALGGLILLGFFTVLAAMVTRRLPAGAETEFSIMLGALATMAAAVVNYYFGSSAGSKEKTRALLPLGDEGAAQSIGERALVDRIVRR